MVRFTRFSALIAALALSLVSALPAFAAASALQTIDVITHDEGSQAVMLISGTLPEDATLPAEISLSAPQGTQLQWAGEILGGDPSADPQATPKKSTAEGADVYTFTLTKARMGQVEVITPPAAFDGQSTYAKSIEWVSAQAVPEVNISGRIPTGSTISQQVEGAQMQPGPDGFSYYTKTFTDVKPGDTVGLAFAYSAPPAAPAGAVTGAPASDNTMPMLIAFLVVVVGAALFAVGISKKMGAKRARAAGDALEDDDDESPEAPTPATVAVVMESADETPEPDEPVVRKRMSPVALMAVILGLVVVIAFVVVGQSSKPTLVDGTLSRAFGGVGACQTAALAFTPADGVDLAREGDKLIDSLNGIESIGQVTLYPAESRITVEFCDSSTNEEAIKGALASTGLVSW